MNIPVCGLESLDMVVNTFMRGFSLRAANTNFNEEYTTLYMRVYHGDYPQSPEVVVYTLLD